MNNEVRVNIDIVSGVEGLSIYIDVLGFAVHYKRRALLQPI